MRTGPRKQRHGRRVNISSISQLPNDRSQEGTMMVTKKERYQEGIRKDGHQRILFSLKRMAKSSLEIKGSTIEEKGFIDQVSSLAHILTCLTRK